MIKNLLLSLLLAGSTWALAWAQAREVTGKVISAEDGSALPGVSVVVKGTNTGTNTNANGSYSVTVPGSGATLVFSFVGSATQEIVVGSRSVIDVKLASDTKNLLEVVVTAIGIQREKKGLGYAVSAIDAEAIAQRSEPDPLRALSAKMPGVTVTGGGGAPGQATKINIRGFNSLTGSTQPLFVVDGIPFDNSVNAGGAGSFASNTGASNRAYDIDPNNIETVTVLKGAAAAALYGSRAVNGVILITTKAGSKKARKGLEVSFNSSYNVEQVSKTPDYQNVYMQGSNQNYNGGFIGNWGSPFPSEVDRINNEVYGGRTRYTKVNSLYRFGPDKGKPYPEGTAEHPLAPRPNVCAAYPELCDQYGNGIPINLKPHDIIGGFFQQGRLIENGLNISSTGDKTSLNASVSRMTNQGIVPSQEGSRTSISFGGTAQLVNKLNVSGNVNYVNTTTDNPPIGAGFYTDYGGFGNEGSIFGRLFYLPRNYDLNGYPFELPATGDNLFYRPLDNPYWSIKYNRSVSNVNRAYGNMALSYDIAPWLNVLVKGGINTYTDTRSRHQAKGGVSAPLGFVRKDILGFTEMDYNAIVTITKDFSEDISFRAIVGGNANQRERTRVLSQGTDIIARGVNNAASTATQQVFEDSRSLRRLYGLYSDVQLGFRNYLFLGLTGRNDWSSTLPATNRSYFYPAATVSFVLSDALSMPAVVDLAKVRAAYGKVGSDTDPYNIYNIYPLGVAYRNHAGQTFYNATASNTLNNAELRPEFKSELEVGFETQLFNNRVGIDFTWFSSNARDQIVSQRIASSSGYDNKVVNAGEISNKGVELGLNLVPLRLSNGFEWTSSFAFTRIRSLVVDAGPQGEIFLGGTGLSSLGTIHRTGEQYGQIFGTKNARDEQGNRLIYRNTGLPFGMAQSQIIGNPNPNYTLGWTNTFSWKGLSLSALFDYREGGQMYSATAASLLLRGQLANSVDREGLRVIPGVYGDPSTYKAVLGDNGQPIKNTTGVTSFDTHFSNGFGAYGQDEVNVYDVTTLRLREVALGYSLPKTLLAKTPFGTARLTVSGRNLWFITPNMLDGLNFDPETLSSFPDSNIQGFDLGAQPTTRRLGVNLMLTF